MNTFDNIHEIKTYGKNLIVFTNEYYHKLLIFKNNVLAIYLDTTPIILIDSYFYNYNKTANYKLRFFKLLTKCPDIEFVSSNTLYRAIKKVNSQYEQVSTSSSINYFVDEVRKQYRYSLLKDKANI